MCRRKQPFYIHLMYRIEQFQFLLYKNIPWLNYGGRLLIQSLVLVVTLNICVQRLLQSSSAGCFGGVFGISLQYLYILYVCSCTLLNAFHRMRGLCVWLSFIGLSVRSNTLCPRIYHHFWRMDAVKCYAKSLWLKQSCAAVLEHSRQWIAT